MQITFTYRGEDIVVTRAEHDTSIIYVAWSNANLEYRVCHHMMDERELQWFATGIYEARNQDQITDEGFECTLAEATQRIVDECERKIQGTLITSISICPQTQTVAFKYIGNETIKI